MSVDSAALVDGASHYDTAAIEAALDAMLAHGSFEAGGPAAGTAAEGPSRSLPARVTEAAVELARLLAGTAQRGDLELVSEVAQG